MCGIVGFSGRQDAAPILLDALTGLEYRGYDSAGISVFGQQGIVTVKAKGRLDMLRSRIDALPAPLAGCCGIGHTRWATHGEPSDVNAHPHSTDKLSLVHNGIIENMRQLRTELTEHGCIFLSQTDTEVAARLLDQLYSGDPFAAIARLQQRLEGSFALAVLFADRPGEVYATRRGSPLIAAVADCGNFFASDIPAILPYTRTYALLEEDEIACITSSSLTICDSQGRPHPPQLQTATWTVAEARRDGYPHFMLKEIHEQPRALRDTLSPYLRDGLPSFSCCGIPRGFWAGFDRVSLVACGTAWHAGQVGRALIERLARIPCSCELASEFRYQNPILTQHTLVVLVSQSGETADTLAALRLARERGACTLAIVNVPCSSIAREADYVVPTYAGPEIAVASTKAYSVQLAVLYLLAFKLALGCGRLGMAECCALCAQLLDAAASTELVLELSDTIAALVRPFAELNDLFFIGRGLDYPLAMEGSLKLKEISYIHCEAYAAGELKHGTISLITPGTPVVALGTAQALWPKLQSNIREVASRGAQVLLICKHGENVGSELCRAKLELPALDDLFMPFPAAVALQLLAYHTAVLRGCDIDKPRNLAKSVTVE